MQPSCSRTYWSSWQLWLLAAETSVAAAKAFTAPGVLWEQKLHLQFLLGLGNPQLPSDLTDLIWLGSVWSILPTWRQAEKQGLGLGLWNGWFREDGLALCWSRLC